MSTRCQIAFYEKGEKDLNKFRALLYKHWDGYPGLPAKDIGTLTAIVPFLKWYKAIRGFDPEYCAARLLQYLCDKNDNNKVGDKTHKEIDAQYSTFPKKKVKPLTGITGYGISADFHSDIEYLYAIYPTEIKVYKTTFLDEPGTNINKRVDLAETVKY